MKELDDRAKASGTTLKDKNKKDGFLSEWKRYDHPSGF